jgi:hypothetical protein
VRIFTNRSITESAHARARLCKPWQRCASWMPARKGVQHDTLHSCRYPAQPDRGERACWGWARGNTERPRFWSFPAAGSAILTWTPSLGVQVGALESFRRGAYRLFAPATGTAEINPLTQSPGAEKNATLTPSGGVGGASRAPSPGVGARPTAPSPGAAGGCFGVLSTPSPGDHLDNHLPASAAKDVQDVEGVHGAKRKAAPVRSAQHCPTGDGRRVPLARPPRRVSCFWAWRARPLMAP